MPGWRHTSRLRQIPEAKSQGNSQTRDARYMPASSCFVIWHLWHSWHSSSGIHGIRHLAFMAFVIWHLWHSSSGIYGIHGIHGIHGIRHLAFMAFMAFMAFVIWHLWHSSFGIWHLAFMVRRQSKTAVSLYLGTVTRQPSFSRSKLAKDSALSISPWTTNTPRGFFLSVESQPKSS